MLHDVARSLKTLQIVAPCDKSRYIIWPGHVTFVTWTDDHSKYFSRQNHRSKIIDLFPVRFLITQTDVALEILHRLATNPKETMQNHATNVASFDRGLCSALAHLFNEMLAKKSWDPLLIFQQYFKHKAIKFSENISATPIYKTYLY